MELGGTDQKFNLLAGRDLQIQFNQPPQIVMMTPLIEGLDGSKKMSKTQGNYIAVDDTPEDMFGKTMSIRDDLMVKYFILVTDEDENMVDKYRIALDEMEKHQELLDPLHPMQIKKALARRIVSEYHDRAAAERAEEHFEKVVQRKEIPDEVPLRLFGQEAASAYELVTQLSGVSSSEARRLIDQGALRIAGTKISDPASQIAITADEQLVQVGKRRFFRIKLGDGS